MMIISRNYQCILLCIIELSLSSFVWCAFLMTDTYRAISGCNKDRKHTGSSAIYNSRSQLDCASKCSETFDCTGINHCLLSGVSTCDLMYVTSRPPSCNVLKPQEGCTYFHKGPCWNGGILNREGDTCQCPFNYAGLLCERYIQDCVEAYDQGYRQSAVTMVQPSTQLPPFEVKCRLVYKPEARILKRNIEGTDHFFGKTWSNYKFGFGTPAKNNMWLGLEHMRQLLNVGGRLYTARIAVHFIGDDRVYDGYLDGVHIASEEDDYRITYSNFRTDGLNNLPDAFSETGRGINGQPFCTPDRDCGECAKDSNSGWWFSTSCAGVNINLPASKLVWPINGEPAAIAKVTVDIFPLD